MFKYGIKIFDGFNTIIIPNGVKCRNPNCSCPSHANDIDTLYDSIIDVLSECSKKLENDKHISKKCGIPGWNDLVKDVHAAARDAYLLWKHSGKPRQGVIYDLMKQTRSKFKYALRVCKGNKNSIISDKIAEAMCSKNDRAFWREIKNSSNSKIKLPNVVGNAQGSDNISGMWQEHYSHIFNMVHESNCKDLHSDLCSNHSLFDQDMVVTSNEMEDIIKDLSYNKSPIIIPIIKNKNKRISDKDNYRPICLANVFTKVVEKVLYSRMEGYLQSTSNQFGFKRKHGTEMCVFVLKKLIRYYIKHGYCMYVAFLDASKAFDRVNHTKLFSKLLRLGVPTWIIKVLVQWYCNQSMCVRWDQYSLTSFLLIMV